MAHNRIGDVVEVAVDKISTKPSKEKVFLRLASLKEDHKEYATDPYYPEYHQDEYGVSDASYYGTEGHTNEFGDEFTEPQYYDQYYDLQNPEPSMGLSQSMSYDRLVGVPEISMYHPDQKQYNSMQYAPGELGYTPYQNEMNNTTSTTYSYQNLRKSTRLFLGAFVVPCESHQLRK